EQVRVVDGTATITLGDGRQVSMMKGTQLKLTKAPSGSGDRPTLLAGELLVEAPHSPLAVNAGDSDVEVDRGAARLTRDLTVVVRTYTGSSTVTSAGRSLDVPALRQVNVPGVGLLPAAPSPLSYTAGDSWDERFLGDAIQLGDELAARSRGFTAQLPAGEVANAGFYRQLIPALTSQPDFESTFPVPDRPAGETLVGLAITAEGAKGSFADRLQQIFGFHDAGATWGLVALDQGVKRVTILGTVDEALGHGPTLVAEQPVTTSRSSSRSSTRAAAPAPAPEPASLPAQAATPTPSSASPPISNAGPLRTGVPLVDGTVNSLVDVLSGLLGALGR
ncbi:MAG: hypothetical protein M3159_05215, partial [Actinomycetota bacterium]|nr:hypothetical protein [Actinomycetota bacterium]